MQKIHCSVGQQAAAGARDLDAELADVVFEIVVVHTEEQRAAGRHDGGVEIADREGLAAADSCDERTRKIVRQLRVDGVAA